MLSIYCRFFGNGILSVDVFFNAQKSSCQADVGRESYCRNNGTIIDIKYCLSVIQWQMAKFIQNHVRQIVYPTSFYVRFIFTAAILINKLFKNIHVFNFIKNTTLLSISELSNIFFIFICFTNDLCTETIVYKPKMVGK